MGSRRSKQVYAKDETQSLRDTIQKLKSQLKRAQKELKESRSENNTLLEAWSKTEAFLEEVTDGVPLEKVLKYKKLPKKIIKEPVPTEDTKEAARKKWAKWRKDNL
jgi:chromosome segregation ATPase